ncbi:MAG: hypothetical protein E3K36_16305 [Candidatus Brocadia sp.]|nr:hypothetical protein [Candidatus Brocadia sp.]
MTNKINQSIEPAKIPPPPPHKPMNTWKHLVAHVCIWFLVVVLIMVYFTSTGSPQAGLLEVGISALIFVVLFHLVMKFFPLITKIITSVIVIGFGIALIFVNYHYLKAVKKDASLKQLLVGDLLVHKILKTAKKEPIALVTKEEMPETVTEPKYEIPQPAISPGQFKTTIANPIIADPVVSHITALAPVVKAGTVFITGKYEPGISARGMKEGISGLQFTTKKSEPIIQPVMERQTLTFASLLPFIQETSIDQLQSHKIQPPLSEMTSAIRIIMINLSGPLKEGRIPID